MFKKITVLLMVVFTLSTTASAQGILDTMITGSSDFPLHDYNFTTYDTIEIEAMLYQYNNLNDGSSNHNDAYWEPQTLRCLDLSVVDSNGTIVHTDQARTRFFTSVAHFGGFKIFSKGQYVCYIKYFGGNNGLKDCEAHFNINMM